MSTKTTPSNVFPIFTMKKNDHIIKLYSMVHIAPEEFFDITYGKLANDVENDFIIHHESAAKVVDVDATMYASIASHLDLMDQGTYLMNSGIYIKKVDLPASSYTNRDIFRLNIIVRMLDAVDEQFNRSKDKEKDRKKFKEMVFFYDHKPSLLQYFLIGTTITTERSNYAAKKAMEETGNVALVWGKAHIKEIAEELLKNGYDAIDVEDIIVDKDMLGLD